MASYGGRYCSKSCCMPSTRARILSHRLSSSYGRASPGGPAPWWFAGAIEFSQVQVPSAVAIDAAPGLWTDRFSVSQLTSVYSRGSCMNVNGEVCVRCLVRLTSRKMRWGSNLEVEVACDWLGTLYTSTVRWSRVSSRTDSTLRTTSSLYPLASTRPPAYSSLLSGGGR